MSMGLDDVQRKVVCWRKKADWDERQRSWGEKALGQGMEVHGTYVCAVSLCGERCVLVCRVLCVCADCLEHRIGFEFAGATSHLTWLPTSRSWHPSANMQWARSSHSSASSLKVEGSSRGVGQGAAGLGRRCRPLHAAMPLLHRAAGLVDCKRGGRVREAGRPGCGACGGAGGCLRLLLLAAPFAAGRGAGDSTRRRCCAAAVVGGSGSGCFGRAALEGTVGWRHWQLRAVGSYQCLWLLGQPGPALQP